MNKKKEVLTRPLFFSLTKLFIELCDNCSINYNHLLILLNLRENTNKEIIEENLENNLQTYKNMTQMITRTIGNQKTGNDTAKTSFNLKDINPHAKALMFNSSYGPSVAYTLAAGTRKYVSTWTGAFVASQTITMTFTTTKESTDTTTSATTVSVPFSTDDTTTKANLLTAIKANSGIDGTLTSFSGNTLTIRTKTGYYMTVTAQMTSTGGSSPPTTTNVETDTSIVTTSIDQTNGDIS